MFLVIFGLLFTAYTSATHQELTPQRKHPSVAERTALDKIFVSSMFNDAARLDLQRAQILTHKTADFKKILEKNKSLLVYKNMQGDTPLFRALQGIEVTVYGSNQEDVSTEYIAVPIFWITFALDHGANINEHDSEGKTALHYAAERTNVPLITALLSYEPETTLRDNAGMRAIDYLQPDAHDSLKRAQKKESIKKMLEAYDEHRYQSTKHIFARIYETEGINVPERVAGIIAKYDTQAGTQENSQ